MADIHNLLPFVQAVRCGSFMAAAGRLQVTPPAVSKSISKLERELGVRLFNRTTRKLDLTHEGKLFFQRISPLLAELDAAVTEISRAPQIPQGLIRVSTTPTFGRYCLTPILAKFFQRYPDVELDISYDESPPNLVSDGFDVSIQHMSGRATSHVSRVLCDYPIVLVASPDYLARKGVPRALEDLPAHDFVCFRLPYGRSTLRLERSQKRERKTARRVDGINFTPRGPLTVANQVDANLLACLYDAGITPSSLPVVLPYLKSGRLKLVLPEYRVRGTEVEGDTSQIHILYPHRQHLPAKVKAFVEFLIEFFRSDRKLAANLDAFAA